MAAVDGAGLLVRSLRAHGVETLFSVPGDPMGPFLDEAARAGIENYTIRHEQAIAMAAQAFLAIDPMTPDLRVGPASNASMA